MHVPKSTERRTPISNDQGKANNLGVSLQGAKTRIRSPDSTSIESECIPSSTCGSQQHTPANGCQGMFTNDSLKSPPRKDTTPNSKVTPQSTVKPEVKSASKRKLFSSPSVSNDEDDKRGTPKRKKTSEPNSANSTPKSSGRLSVPLSERQQMALLMQMTAESPDILRSPVSSTKSPKESLQSRKLNKRNEKGETPLHSATIKGDSKLVNKLIRQGADINIPDFAGWTPLHEACNHGWYDISKYLLRAGATVNVKGLDDDTPLHDASINGHRKLVALLVKSGADPHQANSRGKTPLDVATTEEVKKILKGEIVPSSSDESGDDEPRSPTSTESDLNDGLHDDTESVHSTSKDNDEVLDVVQLLADKADLVNTVAQADSEQIPSSASSTMRKTSPPHSNINKGPEKPSSPRLTLRFQSIRNKDLKNNTASTSAKCDTGLVSSTEQKYPSYSVTMETKDDVYEFKQDTPPPVPLSSSRVPPLSAPSSTSEPCDSQFEVIDVRKDCDSSTVEKTSDSEKNVEAAPAADSEKNMDVTQNPRSPTSVVDSATYSEVHSVDADEVQKKRRKDESSPEPQSVVSSTSKPASVAEEAPKLVESTAVDDKPEPMDIDVADTTNKFVIDLPSVSSSVSPPLVSSAPGSGSSSPKVPPLKIVIPQTEPDSKDRNKTNSIRQALPYVVNSTAADDTCESTMLYSSSSNSQTTDSVCVTYSKPADSSANSTTNEATPERTQRITRSTHRMQVALEKVNQNNSDPVDNSRDTEETNNNNTIGVHPRKRKLRSREANVNNSESNPSSASSTSSHEDQPTLNCYHMYLDIRKQIDKRRKNLFVVQPKPPQDYKDYLINRCSYVLEGNASSRISVPMIPPPQSLSGVLKDLFVDQEKERYKLRLQHLIEREKLVLSVEQEILRVHTRAARALANQSVPLSICTILKDEEIYNSLEPEQEDKDKNVRSRYNGRLFLSWLQDVHDKWDKIKRAMLLRHHNEAESLHAVHKMSWEWKMKEVGPADTKSSPVVDDLNVPMVQVNDDFELLPA